MAQTITTWRIPAVLWKAFQRLGYDAGPLVARANLPDHVRHDPSCELTTVQTFALWRALSDLAQDPLLGFKLMKAASKVGTDSTFLAASRAATFDDALTLYLQTRSLHSPARITRENQGEAVCFTRHIPGSIEDEPDVAVDFTLGTLLALGRVGTGVDVKAHQVFLKRERATSSFHQEFFGCPIHYKSPCNAIAFKTGDLRRPLISHDGETLASLSAGIRTGIEDRHAAETIERLVKATVREQLPRMSVSLSSVAAALGMSERSLQRRLSHEERSFTAVVTEVRQEVASDLLATSSMKVAAVAAFVGYDDASSFLRAFRAWKGVTPSEWRRRTIAEQGGGLTERGAAAFNARDNVLR